MLYTQEDLPKVVEQIQTRIREFGLDVGLFEIDIRESDNSIRVAAYTDYGGCMVRLFGTNDFDRMEREIRDFFKLDNV